MSEGSLGRGIDSSLANQATKVKTDQSDDGREAIIRAVAVKHGIALGNNDPILVLQTINGLLMDEFARKQEVLIRESHINLEAAADLWSKNVSGNLTAGYQFFQPWLTASLSTFHGNSCSISSSVRALGNCKR